MNRLGTIVNRSRYYLSRLNPIIARIEKAIPRKNAYGAEVHLKAAARWICAAQDAFDDGGVARSFSLVYKPFFNKKGWISSYPETTGYIIPTMFDYAGLSGNLEYFDRAVRMADWECEVQLPEGAVRGGTIDTAKPSPAVFNTGQVIFGWIRTYKETGDKKYLDCAVKAGEYLLNVQDPDGAWRKNLSDFATDRIETYSYNTRTAWALLALALATGVDRYRTSAIKNIEHALGQQLPNGWFRNNCLYNPDAPLLHTIAYAIRGVLEAGVILKEDGYIKKALVAADALVGAQSSDGSLPGRLDRNWKSTVNYSCLTGVAQTAIIWGRLYQICGDKKYLSAMKSANRFLKTVQILDTGNPDLDGGISGSYPLSGIYGQYEVLNWAVKFFMDSLMLESKINRRIKV